MPTHFQRTIDLPKGHDVEDLLNMIDHAPPGHGLRR